MNLPLLAGIPSERGLDIKGLPLRSKQITNLGLNSGGFLLSNFEGSTGSGSLDLFYGTALDSTEESKAKMGVDLNFSVFSWKI